MWAEGTLSQGVRGKLSDRSFGLHERATTLMDFITERIKDTPSDFHKFITVLKKLGPWAHDTVERLKETYTSKSKGM